MVISFAGREMDSADEGSKLLKVRTAGDLARFAQDEQRAVKLSTFNYLKYMSYIM